jgi:hypothetical protein
MTQSAKIAVDIGAPKTLIIDLRELFRLDSDPEKQEVLRRLLIEELDKLARKREQQEELESLILRGREQVRNGGDRYEQQEQSNPASDNRDDRRTLELMETIKQLLENFQTRVLSMYPYAVKLRNTVVGVCATLDEAERLAKQSASANPDEAVVTVFDARQDRSETFHPEGYIARAGRPD